MPLGSIIILSGIVAAFLLFAVVLAWVDFQTRHLVRNKKPAPSHDERHDIRSAADEKVIA
jgi:hypothetical protein